MIVTHNASHLVGRTQEVIVDTARVNFLSEFGDITGTTASGANANWAAKKYKIKMQVDLERLPDNSTKAYQAKKKQIAHNAQEKQKKKSY